MMQAVIFVDVRLGIGAQGMFCILGNYFYFKVWEVIGDIYIRKGVSIILLRI